MFKKTSAKMRSICGGIKSRSKASLIALSAFFVASSASAQDLVSYDSATNTTSWDTSVMVAEIMKSFTAGLSLLMVFLPIAIGVGMIIYYTKKGVKN